MLQGVQPSSTQRRITSQRRAPPQSLSEDGRGDVKLGKKDLGTSEPGIRKSGGLKEGSAAAVV